MINFKTTYTHGVMACTILMGLLGSCNDTDVIPDLTSAKCPSAITLNIPEDLQKYIYVDNNGVSVLPLVKGQHAKLGYSLSPDDATYNNVVWTSSVPSVATVDDGTIEAVSGKGLGYSIVTVTPVGMYPGSGVASTLKVRVDDELISAGDIAITAPTHEVYEGETLALSAEIIPENTTYRTLEWTSSDVSVATVDNNGVVTARKVKSETQSPVTITGTALDGSGVTASVNLLVKAIVDPTDITIDQAYAANNYVCAANEKTLVLKYATTPEDCTLSQIKWTSSDNSVATVADGVVTFTGYGDVTITATCPNGNSSSINLHIPAGLIRETYHNPNYFSFYVASQSGNGTTTAYEWHDGYIDITTYKVNATTQRGDMKWWNTPVVLHAGNYPIIAVKMDDVRDKYKDDGVTSCNINFDCVGRSESGVEYKALGNGNNKYSGNLKCSDGSHVFIYDMRTLAFGTGGLAPANEAITFSVFQIKYADMKTVSKQLHYNLYWLQTFKSVDDVKHYLTDVDKVSYEVIK